MERKEAIRNAYRLTGGNSFYDGMITCSTVPGRAVCRLVWGMDKAQCDAYLADALSGIPEDFSGRLLEVPVGTGILTMPLYQTLPQADITCLDYSPDMMAQAQEKAARMGLTNVTFQQGDVSALHYADGSFDVRDLLRLLLCGRRLPPHRPAHPPSLPAHEVLYAALRDGGQPGSPAKDSLRTGYRRPREEHRLVRLPQGRAGMKYVAFAQAHRRWLEWRKGG